MSKAPKQNPIKLLQIIQKESGPFSASNNLLSIDFEPGNCTDLSKSYLNMEVAFKMQDDSVPPVGRVKLGDVDSEYSYDTDCFIRHATLRSDTVGLIEQQRYNNVYNQTLKQYLSSSEKEAADCAFGDGEAVIDENGVAHLIVPMTRLLGCASAKDAEGNPILYPDYKMGQTRLELELESTRDVAYSASPGQFSLFSAPCANQADVTQISSVTLSQKMTAPAFNDLIIPGDTYTLTFNDGVDVQDEEIVITTATLAADGTVVVNFDAIAFGGEVSLTAIVLSAIGGAANGSAYLQNITNATGATVTYNTITVLNKQADDFVVGKYYSVCYYGVSNPAAPATDNWASFGSHLVSATNAGANVTLVFLDPVVSLGAGQSTNVVGSQPFILGVYLKEALKWSINKVYLIQAKPVNQVMVDKFMFQTNLLEMVNLPAANEFRRQVELEEGTDRVIAINPVGNLVGIKQFTSYRNSVNSVDTITTDVVFSYGTNASIYYDRLLYAIPELVRLQSEVISENTTRVAIVPEIITPEQALVPNNVIEFQLRRSEGPVVVASIIYFFKRNMKMF
jgi:hypothetical protein